MSTLTAGDHTHCHDDDDVYNNNDDDGGDDTNDSLCILYFPVVYFAFCILEHHSGDDTNGSHSDIIVYCVLAG